jgi:quercetin dioxygenase-like cupin family protein
VEYVYIANPAGEVEPPADGIFSRTLHSDEHIKVVLFGFGAGQELSEHTASVPAILYVVQGEARLTFGGDTVEAGPGAWTYMRPHLKHSVLAKTPVKLLLVLMKQSG